MKERTRAREVVIITLYHCEILNRWNNIPYLIERFFESLDFIQKETKKDLTNGAVKFGKQIFLHITELKDELDQYIAKYCNNWPIDRINTLDKCILRVALYEILYLDDIPYKVSLNEAIELAKRYTGLKSAKFVNGLLDNFLKKEIYKKNS